MPRLHRFCFLCQEKSFCKTSECSVPRAVYRHSVGSCTPGWTLWSATIVPVSKRCRRKAWLDEYFHSLSVLWFLSGQNHLVPLLRVPLFHSSSLPRREFRKKIGMGGEACNPRPPVLYHCSALSTLPLIVVHDTGAYTFFSPHPAFPEGEIDRLRVGICRSE